MADKLAGPDRSDSYKVSSPTGSFSKRGIFAAVEEGGRKGVEMAEKAAKEGQAFYHYSIESAEGNLTLLTRALNAANAPAPALAADGAAEPNAEQGAGGGASHLGKMFLSAGPKQLAVVAHIPLSLAKEREAKVKDWVEAALKNVHGAKVVEADEETVKAVAKVEDGITSEEQMKEAIAAGVRYMRNKGHRPLLTH